jgi:hypothetical protein
MTIQDDLMLSFVTLTQADSGLPAVLRVDTIVAMWAFGRRPGAGNGSRSAPQQVTYIRTDDGKDYVVREPIGEIFDRMTNIVSGR